MMLMTAINTIIELAGLQFTDYLIKLMDQGGTPLNIYIYIDLSKAFDTLTLNQSISLSKLLNHRL